MGQLTHQIPNQIFSNILYRAPVQPPMVACGGKLRQLGRTISSAILSFFFLVWAMSHTHTHTFKMLVHILGPNPVLQQCGPARLSITQPCLSSNLETPQGMNHYPHPPHHLLNFGARTKICNFGGSFVLVFIIVV